ncbi:cyclophilin-like fold protein [Marinomonas aquimarina]|uniref:cyclophilin-like fold protein n=1 Tax=Marinomonas aquimarina TaxID=295068 RepID=UPI0018D3CAAD|nr:cyclophilin-like fold protein [Marinomonas aquimarina]
MAVTLPFMASVAVAETTEIRVIAGDQVIHASLNDSSASRDFLAQLPLQIELSDYHSTEKIAYLPKALSTTGMPKAMDPEVGDFTYFAPWGNIALFYKDFGYSRGLVKLGEIHPEDINLLQALPKVNVIIERSQP